MDDEVEPSEADDVQRKRSEKRKGKKIAEPVVDPMDEEEQPGVETGTFGGNEQAGDASEPEGCSKSEIVYSLLSKQAFLGTRFPEDDTMEALGIREEVQLLFRNMGLERMMQMQAGGYQDETCQFLATLQLHEYDEDDREDFSQGFGWITFTVNGIEYSASYRQLEDLYGFPNGEDKEARYKDTELKALWKYIATGHYSPSQSKCSHIRSPVLRYVHKALANTYFARASTSYVTLGEIQLLDKGLAPITKYLGRTKMVGEQSNAGLIGPFLEQLLSYQDTAYNNRGRTTRPTLHVGGIITPILLACNVPVDEEGYVQHRWLDIDYLRRSQILEHNKVWDNYVYRFDHPIAGPSKIFLPCHSYTRFINGKNADFYPSKECLYIPGQGQDRAQAQHEPMEEDLQEDESVAEPERYFFDDYPYQGSEPAVVAAHQRISLLQKFSKWHISKVDQMKETMGKMAQTIKNLEKKVTRSTKKKSKPQPFMRSRSFTQPIRRTSAQDAPRPSSFEPREEQRQRQKKRRSSGSRQSDFSGGLEQTHPDFSGTLELASPDQRFEQAPQDFTVRFDHGGGEGGPSYQIFGEPQARSQQPHDPTASSSHHQSSTLPPKLQGALDDIFGRR